MAGLGKFSRLKARLAGGGVEIKMVLVAGAGANTNIAISGLKANAQILGCVQLEGSATYTAPTDRGANVSKVTAGNIQLNTSTTGDDLLVIYAQPA